MRTDGFWQLFYSKPGVVYFGSKTAIEALTGIGVGAIAIGYTTDMETDGEFGYFDGTDWHWGGTGGAGLVDGNYGDITVGGSGTTMTINNAAVTFAKMLDATGQYKIVGRSSVGVGSFQEISSSADVFALLGAANYAGMKTLLGYQASEIAFTPASGISATDAQAAIVEALTDAKTYADSLVVGLLDDRGVFDASVNAYPSSGGSGTAGAILKGDLWNISVAGTLPTGQAVEVGDWVRALVDTPGNTQANWAIIQNNIGYVAENQANKTDTMAGNEASSTKYLSSKGVYDYLTGLVWLTAAIFGNWFVALTGKTTPVDGDSLLLSDSASSGDAKKVTWANVKATLKAYFDGLYVALTGWVTVNDSWSYASATTITVPSGAASRYSVGDKVSFVQSATTKYFYITVVADTLLTVYAGSDFTVANVAISSIFYSKVTNPIGMTEYFNYVPTYTNFSLGSGTVDARFKKQGKLVTGFVEILMASDSSVSGSVYISLPSTPVGVIRTPIALLTLLEAGVAQSAGVGVVEGSSIRLKAFGTAGADATQVDVTATVPFTWGNLDQIIATFSYLES